VLVSSLRRIVIVDLIFCLIFNIFVSKVVEANKRGSSWDVGLVLSGPVQKSKLSDHTKSRIKAGVDLLNKKYIKHLVIVGGNRGQKKLLLQDTTSYLSSLAVKKNHYTIGIKSFDTVSNWSEFLAISAQEKWASVVIISSYYHLPRAFDVARRNNKYNQEISLFPAEGVKYKYGVFSKVYSMHYELFAYLLSCIISNKTYSNFVRAVRFN
jgi:uncharacterized SAM-binding protein YcdF (DUF218 family)